MYRLRPGRPLGQFLDNLPSVAVKPTE